MSFLCGSYLDSFAHPRKFDKLITLKPKKL
jgi:hypothetical protein